MHVIIKMDNHQDCTRSNSKENTLKDAIFQMSKELPNHVHSTPRVVVSFVVYACNLFKNMQLNFKIYCGA